MPSCHCQVSTVICDIAQSYAWFGNHHHSCCSVITVISLKKKTLNVRICSSIIISRRSKCGLFNAKCPKPFAWKWIQLSRKVPLWLAVSTVVTVISSFAPSCSPLCILNIYDFPPRPLNLSGEDSAWWNEGLIFGCNKSNNKKMQTTTQTTSNYFQ